MSIPPFPATPYAGVQTEMLENEQLAVITHRGIRIDDLRELFDGTFAALGEAIANRLFLPVGPALAVYRGDPAGVLDVEIGFPAASGPTRAVPTSAGDLHTSALPSGPAAIASHIGSYAGLGDAWAALAAAVPGTPTGTWVEVYVADPSSTPEAELRTDLVLPFTPA